MNDNTPARRAEDKRADGAVDWTDAPRFTALGIAETWSVTVEAEGQMVLSIGCDHVAGLDGETLEQFAPTIRSCAQHLLGFIGAAPISGTAGAAKGGIASLEGLTDDQIMDMAEPFHEIGGVKFDEVAFARHLLATTAGEQAEPAKAEETVRFCPHCGSIGEIEATFRDCCPDGSAARHIPRKLAEVCRDTFKLAISAASQAAPAAPKQVQAPVAYLHQVVCGDGEPDQALSFEPDNFPLAGTLGYRSISHQPLYLAVPSTAAPAAPEQDEVRDRVRDAVAEALDGVYTCGRVWSAWSVGTMSEDDFAPAGEDDDVVDNIVDAALGAMKTATNEGEAR